MKAEEPTLQALIEQIKRAQTEGTSLCIRGGGSKDFYGEAPVGDRLDVSSLKGISSYEPSELVVTARCGTSLRALEALLAQHGQCLAFEPPHFDANATVGGMVSAGLSGPSRARVGSVRDHVLGATLLTGKGELLSFGGQVIKNVAGYDVSRLLVGAMGTLGVVAEVSLKVLPIARATATLRFEFDEAAALSALSESGGLPLPLDASAWRDGVLWLRLCGAEAAVRNAVHQLPGDVIEPTAAAAFWLGLRNHTDAFFDDARRAITEGRAALWRIGVPQTAPPLDLGGETLIEWHGAQRWLISERAALDIRSAAAAVGGHATLFRSRDKSAGVFTPLAPPIQRIHQELKKAFDPLRVFNRGRMYADL